MDGGTEGEPDAEWQRVADEREREMPKLGADTISGLLRRARRIAGMSQRELARRSGVAQSTVARVEMGEIVPTLPVFERLLATAGLRLVVVDDEGHVIQPMRDIPDTRHLGGWRYPSHLDVILDPRGGQWWGDRYGVARPPETFHRDHDRRLAKQRRSQWEVRAKRVRGVPPPRDVDFEEEMRALREAGLLPPPYRTEPEHIPTEEYEDA